VVPEKPGSIAELRVGKIADVFAVSLNF